ncbi:MAG: hypothetical protein Q9221_004525 [Calogaya cf. arnoldii]
MHKPSLAPIIYARLYPAPKPTDPPNFQVHINKLLVPEVRLETARFYGHIDCIEAQYPGLDYAVTAHRMRLGRFPYHRRLFQIFDQLRLTDYEIQTLCRWEGTRWARERYEKDVGSRVRDTTWEDIIEARQETPTVTRTQLQATDQPEMHLANQDNVMEHWVQDAHDERNYNEEQESEDELQQSVGVELNQRLMAATEARNRGEEAVLDADWEQWLKEAAERGVMPDPTIANAARAIVAGPSNWTREESLPLVATFAAPSTGQLAFNGPSTGTAM